MQIQDHTLPVVCTVKAIYAYMAKEEGDLSLNKDGGWWKGTLVHNRNYGSFPSNFVETIPTTDSGNVNGNVNTSLDTTQSRPPTSHSHSRQASTDSSRFTKRKPVNTETTKANTSHHSPSAISGTANATPRTERRKNPQAILPDSTFEDQTPSVPTSDALTTTTFSSTSTTLTATTPHFQRLAPRFGGRRNSDDSQRSVQSSQNNRHNDNQTAKARRESAPAVGAGMSNSPSFPGAYPDGASTDALSPAQPTSPVVVKNEAVYNASYAELRHGHNSSKTSDSTAPAPLSLNPSVPAPKLSSTLTPTNRQINNRHSMPNLAPDTDSTPPKVAEHLSGTLASNMIPGHMCPQAPGTALFGPRNNSATQSAYSLPQSDHSRSCGPGQGGYDEFGLPKQEQNYFGQNHHHGHSHRNSDDASQQHFQPGIMPRSGTDGYSQGFSQAASIHPLHISSAGPLATTYTNDLTINGHGSTGQVYLQQQQQQQQQHVALQQQQQQQQHQRRGHRHSIANIQIPSASQSPCPPLGKSELSLENLAKHSRSRSALEGPRVNTNLLMPGHGRSRSQVNLKPEDSAAFNPYDHVQNQQQQQQQQYSQHQLIAGHSASMNRIAPMRTLSPSIVIPPVQPQSHASHSLSGEVHLAHNTTSPVSGRPYLYSPDTPSSASTTATTILSQDLTSPRSAGTSMSHTSALSSGGILEQRRKSEAMVRPKYNADGSGAPSTFAVRRFSGDAKQLLTSVTTATATALPPSNLMSSRSTTAASSMSMDPDAADIDMSAYMAKKPKTTLIRAVKQILNPKKVAEKDAIKNKNDHFAWSLKRVSSPEPTLDGPFFNSTGANGHLGLDDPLHTYLYQPQQQQQDPFEVLKRSHAMRDPTAPASSHTLDFGVGTFAEVDKVARNINQRGPLMTPQLLSQKYLTRPYSKSPLLKLRVLFVWVSENIRLEGGPTRDVSGGRYKLGPAGDHMAAVAAAQAAGSAIGSPNGRPPGLGLVPPPAVFMAGIEEYARGFLQEDSPELAQDVLTSRTCKTGEGFANLFAEMALAAGIEDVGVVKGYLRGPMDVFSTEVPPPNHAWNVVRIDGTYRFIDCCLASPFHPAHYPNRPAGASSFYFMTPPKDLVLSHFPTFAAYQFLTPAIPPSIYLKLPFVRPAFFEFGLNLVDFRKRTRLDIKDDQPVEVVVRIDGGGQSTLSGSDRGGNGTIMGGQAVGANCFQGLFGPECQGKGCGEGIELRAEVEAMTVEGKVIRKRALAQIMIWNPYQKQQSGHARSPTSSSLAKVPQSSMGGMPPTATNTTTASNGNATCAPVSRVYHSHHCTGVRIAKVKAVLPADTVVGANGVRKGVLHIYAGRKDENAPSDATPYSLALSLPITHNGTMPRTPFNFVLPHFSPYEFYVKAPQSELLYYPHTYSFCIISLAAQAQVAAAAATAYAEAEMQTSVGATTGTSSATNSSNANNSALTSPTSRYAKSSSMIPLPTYRGQQQQLQQTLTMAGRLSTSISTTSYRNGVGNSTHPYQQHPLQHHTSGASTSSLSMSGMSMSLLNKNSNSPSSSVTLSSLASGGSNGTGGVPRRPERLVLRTQTNRIYKLTYDPLRQCHEAKVEIKERGIWECVRMDDGGKSRVGREGTGGVVIATWKCV
ncbi:cytokinesis protein 3 [Podila epigama]|nr:cytokinesis protein 3 [Podila epigama]